VPVVSDVPATTAPGTLVYYRTIVNAHGPYARRTGTSTHHATWRLQLGKDRATLTISNSDSDRDPLIFEGTLDERNGGIPSDFQQVNGKEHLVLKCSNREIPVHHRGASPRFRCSKSESRAGTWTDDATSVRAISCEQDSDASSIRFLYFPTIVFANPPVEEINVRCTEGDLMNLLTSGHRIAGD
jgi:hypothetical protein